MSDQTLATESPLPAVTHVAVRQLFGHYNYDLSSTSNGRDGDQVLILYGENGSGKTTILRLIYHALSAANNRGHRGFLLRTQFSDLIITLSDGTEVRVNKQGQLLGPFTMTISRPSREPIEHIFEMTEDFKLKSTSSNHSGQYLRGLEELNIGMYYLSDDRTLESDQLPNDESDEQSVRWHDYLTFTSGLRNPLRASQRREGLELSKPIERAVAWVRQTAFNASNIGNVNTHTIYTDIIHGIASWSPDQSAEQTQPFASIILSLTELSHRTRAFALHGLSPEINFDHMITTLSNSHENTHQLLSTILTPYIDSIQARLNALQPLLDIMETFVRNLNELFTNKKITLSIGSGLKIYFGKSELSPEMLSSGERQMLLLLCHTLYARDQATIFIIDEPELSLNVKWQRRLIDTLIECTGDSKMQFIFATHSIELLSRHLYNVVRLPSDQAST